jgi:hypothetical protein
MFASVDAAASAEERRRSPPSPEHDPESAAMERCVKRGLNAARVRRAIELAERDLAAVAALTHRALAATRVVTSGPPLVTYALTGSRIHSSISSSRQRTLRWEILMGLGKDPSDTLL